MVPLVGNIFTICSNLIASGTIGKEIGANGKNENAIGTNGTNVTNQWYHWENPEHMHTLITVIHYRIFRLPMTLEQWDCTLLLILRRYCQFYQYLIVNLVFFHLSFGSGLSF